MLPDLSQKKYGKVNNFDPKNLKNFKGENKLKYVRKMISLEI